jgi:hypothetical protein
MQEERRGKRPRTLLKGYSLYLSGFSDDEILENGLNDRELTKIKNFHEIITEGSQFLSLSMQAGIDQIVAKQMWCMYYDYQRGKTIRYGSERPLRVITAFKLLLNGCSITELEDRGFNEQEISKAHEFLELVRAGAKDRMLTQSMANIMDLPRSRSEKC